MISMFITIFVLYYVGLAKSLTWEKGTYHSYYYFRFLLVNLCVSGCVTSLSFPGIFSLDASGRSLSLRFDS